MIEEIIKQTLEELKSVYNVIHGPEIWLVLPALLLVIFINTIIGFIIFDKWR